MTHHKEADRHAQGADGYDMTEALRRAGVNVEIDEIDDREQERPAA
jgi:hypothetical protein